MILTKPLQTDVKKWNGEPWIILFVALFQGFLYILIVPPWQHCEPFILSMRGCCQTVLDPVPGDYGKNVRRGLVDRCSWFYEKRTITDLQPPIIRRLNPQLDDQPYI
jgi:hypothetical protein